MKKFDWESMLIAMLIGWAFLMMKDIIEVKHRVREIYKVIVLQKNNDN